MSKKLEQKQARREAEERRRAEERKAALKRNALTIGLAVIVLAAVIALIYVQREQGEGPVSGNIGVSASEANCGEIETFDEQEASHIDVGAAHDPYNSSPPTSGPHYEVPADTDFYPDALPPEQVVHNLEHGQIVIWYQPGADSETLQNIEDLVRQEPVATVATPYTDIEAPYNFVLSGWTALQRCEFVSQEVVDDFRREYQGMGPEKLTQPFDG